jgi:uncharacterized protein (DUF849 family)
MDKLIIEVRANEYAMRERNRNVPWTAEELGRDAAEVRAAGASIIHFHARNADGSPAHATADYAAAIRAIRAASDLLVHPTLGQITVSDVSERVRHVRELAADPRLAPDICPIDTGSTNIDIYDQASRRFASGDKTYLNTTETLLGFADTFRALGVRPCLVAWAIPFLRTIDAMLEMGRLDEPAYVLLYHSEGGLLGAHPATAAGLRAYLDCLPPRNVHWTVGCKGGNLFALATTAIQMGGHVSIGIGDYAYPELGCPSNAELVREVVKLAKVLGRKVATPEDTREILGIGKTS